MPAPRTPHAVLGEVIRRLREERDLSQEALADRSDLHRNAVGLIERGERDPSWGTVARIAAGLRLSISDLARAYEDATARRRSR